MIPLTKKVDGVDRPLYVARKISTKAVVNPSMVSNTAGVPVANVGVDLEFLPILIDVFPVFDATYNTLSQTSLPNEVLHQWEIKYIVTPKTQTEALAAMDAAFRAEVNKKVAIPDASAGLIALVLAIIREAKVKNLTPAEQSFADSFQLQVTKILADQANLDSKKSQVKTGGKPDPKTGWSP